MQSFIDTLGQNLGVVTVLTIAVVVIVSSILKHLSAVIMSSTREKSRREIAAYIASGSITPDQGERLIRADVNSERGRVGGPFG